MQNSLFLACMHSEIVSMIRKYHYHKLQTNLWHRKEEPHNNHRTSGRQTKQCNQLFFPHQDDCKPRMEKLLQHFRLHTERQSQNLEFRTFTHASPLGKFWIFYLYSYRLFDRLFAFCAGLACGALAASICFGIVIPFWWLSIYITYY